METQLYKSFSDSRLLLCWLMKIAIGFGYESNNCKEGEMEACVETIFITSSDSFSLNQNKKEHTESAGEEYSSYPTPLVTLSVPVPGNGGLLVNEGIDS